MQSNTLFHFLAALCAFTLVKESGGSNINSIQGANTNEQFSKSHRIHKRFSIGDLVDDVKEKVGDSANDVINSAVDDLLDDVIPDSISGGLLDNIISNSVNDVINSAVEDLLDDVISDSVDDVVGSVLGGFLDDLDIGDDVIDDVKDLIDDVIDGDSDPTLSGTTFASGKTTTQRVTNGFTTQGDPDKATSQRASSVPAETTTGIPGEKVTRTSIPSTRNPGNERVIRFLLSPVSNFMNTVGNITQNGINRVIAGFTNGIQEIDKQRISNFTSQVEKRMKEVSEEIIEEFSPVIIEFVDNLTTDDIAFLDRIESDIARTVLENNIEDVLPVLVRLLFKKATFEELRCAIAKSVLGNQFDRLFENDQFTQILTDVFLSITSCRENVNPTPNSNNTTKNDTNEDDVDKNYNTTTKPLDRATVQAMTALVDFRDESDLASLGTISDAMSFLNPSSSFSLENVLGDLTPFVDQDVRSDIASFFNNTLSNRDGIFSEILDNLLPNDDNSDNSDDNNINSLLSNTLSNLLQPILEPLNLNEAQTEFFTNQIVNLVTPLATSTIQQAGEQVVSRTASNILEQLGLPEEQAASVTAQITNLLNTVIERGLNPGGGDSGENGGGIGGEDVNTLDLATLLEQLRSGADIQEVARALLSGSGGIGEALGLNGSSLYEILPPELSQALSVLSTVQQAATSLTGIYSSNYATSSGCQLERSAVGEGVTVFNPYALMFLDAMGKPGTGILLGNSYFVGNFDQCETANYVTSTGDVIRGHYVKYKFFLTLPPGFPAIGGAITFQEAGLPYVLWGVCMPRGCTEQDAEIVGQGVADGLNLRLLSTEIIKDRDPADDAGFIVAMFVLGTLGLFCLIGTFLDVANIQSQSSAPHRQSTSTPIPGRRHTKSILSTIAEDPATMRSPTGESMVNQPNFRDLRIELGTVKQHEVANNTNREQPGGSGNVNKTGAIWNFFLAFSLPRNTEMILKAKHAPGEITCLHGVRVLSISWVILGHAYFFFPQYGNLTGLQDMSKWWTFNGIRNATYTVDTFFVLSGCLVSYLFLKTAKKAGGLKPMHMFYYYVHRYLRLTPLLGLAILFYACVTPYLEYGPFQREVSDREDACSEKWWWNILYINNLFDTSNFCIGWSWYLPNDMQFYAIAPIIIIPMALGYNFLGLLAAFLQIALHIIMFAYLEEKYDATLSTNASNYFIYMYIKPYTRCGPYAIGLVLGYALFKTKFKAKINKFVVFLGWILAIGGGLTLVFITHDNYMDNGGISPTWTTEASNAYETVVRPLWAACVAWMVFACASGYGGVLNSVLSWQAWIPLSRLTYGVYLFHVMVIHYFNNNRRVLAYLTKDFVIERYLAVFILSYGIAFIASLLVETPVRNLTKPSSSKSKKPTTDHNQHQRNQTSNNTSSGVDSPSSNHPPLSSVLSGLTPAALVPNGKGGGGGVGGPLKKVSFENVPPRFGANAYSSMAAMSKSGSHSPITPTAPAMQVIDVNNPGSNQTFRETPASAASQAMEMNENSMAEQTLQKRPPALMNDADSQPGYATVLTVNETSAAPAASTVGEEQIHVDLDSGVNNSGPEIQTSSDIIRSNNSNSNNTNDNENAQQVGGSGVYPNLADVTDHDPSDWLSAALADGNNTVTSSTQEQYSTKM